MKKEPSMSWKEEWQRWTGTDEKDGYDLDESDFPRDACPSPDWADARTTVLDARDRFARGAAVGFLARWPVHSLAEIR